MDDAELDRLRQAYNEAVDEVDQGHSSRRGARHVRSLRPCLGSLGKAGFAEEESREAVQIAKERKAMVRIGYGSAAWRLKCEYGQRPRSWKYLLTVATH